MVNVLFIDARNSARSPIAESWFNHFAGDSARAFSCGTMPSGKADPLTVKVMKEAGLNLRISTPRILNQQILAGANIVVLMGTDVYPQAFAPKAIWNFRDPTGEPIARYRELRDAIRLRVEALIAEIRSVTLTTQLPDQPMITPL